MSILDELVITDDGDVEVRIIPLDSVSHVEEINATYKLGSLAWTMIGSGCLVRLATALGWPQWNIIRVLHAGQRRYTIFTRTGEGKTVDLALDRPTSLAIAEIVTLVESLKMMRMRGGE